MLDARNLSSLIRSNIDNLMARWEVYVRKDLPSTVSLDRENLFNGLPNFLENLAFYFSVSRSSPEWEGVVRENTEIAKRHGKQRAKQTGYTLDQVIAEHQILRRVLFEFIQQKIHLNPEQWNTLLKCVDVGISEASTAFALEKGFKDAKYRQLESQKEVAQDERNQAHLKIDRLQLERALREQFVSTLSHDLRTPITSAMMAAELISRDTKKSEQVVRLAFKIIDDLSRSDRMIRDMLDANRIRSGEKLSLELRETKLIELIKRTLENLSSVYGDRFKLNANHEIVGYWSAVDLERSIENLVINAVKYGSRDTPIEVRVVDQGERVSISVHNAGSLITPSEQKSLFQPFSRIVSPASKGKKGWGLGLTLVLGIAEAHGGKVRVESEAEKGTTFTILIPKDTRVAGEARHTRAS